MAYISRRLRSVALASLTAAGLFAFAGGPASADTYKFYSGENTYTGAYGIGFVNGLYYAIENPAGSVATNCAVGFAGCSGGPDSIFDPLVYNNFPTTLTATAPSGTNGGSLVWQDTAPVYGGTGVNELGTSPNDHIQGGDILMLSFSRQVQLLAIATLFDLTNHGPTFGATAGGNAYDTIGELQNLNVMFELNIDNLGWNSVSFQLANTIGGINNLIGNTFQFRQLAGQPSFYVSALLANPVPIPAALPLFLGGLGVISLCRRRKQKALSQPV